MSLFPSAEGNKIQTEDAATQNNWLTNKSFTSASSCQLQQHNSIEKRLISEENEKHRFSKKPVEAQRSDDDSSITDEKGSDQSTSSSSSSDDEPKRKRQNIVKHQKKDDDNVLQEGYCIDRKGDKNYLYFRRPYQTRIPKFWRVTTNCLGLPRHLKIELREGKKRKKRKHEPPLERYFHVNENSEDEKKKEDNSLQVEKLNQITRTDPHDEENWIRLVELQDDLSCKNKSLIAEKKVSILDKAISHNQTSVSLKLKRLEILDSVSQDTYRDWENFVFQHSDKKEAWFKYINHIKTSRRFTVRRVLNAFGKSFERLTAHINRSGDDDIKLNYESMMMDIFASLIKFLLECGHDERCFYLLAIMVEININRCKKTTQIDLEDVEKFCRADEPLIGEEKAKGFDSWMQQHQHGGWVTCDDEADDVMDDDDDDEANPDQTLADNWLRIEKMRSKRDFLPWRVKSDCEDEKRRVNFEQIKNLIFFIQDDGNCMKLVELFLRFIGVDFKDRDDLDFQHSHPCHLIHECNDFHDRFTTISDQPCHNNPSSCPHLLKLNPIRHQTLTRIFQQLAKITADAHTSTLFPKLAGLWLDYHRARVNTSRSEEARRKSVKKARIAARNLLQKQPTNTDLWMKFARIELCGGKRDDCRKIVFNSLKSRPSSCGLEICVQFSIFAWKFDGEAVRRVLTALGDDCKFKKHLKSSEPISAAVVLRVGRFYMNKCEDLACLYEGHVCDATGEAPSQLACWLVCTLVYFYLTSPSTLASVEKELSPVVQRIVTVHSRDGNLQAASDLKLIRELQMGLKEELMTSSAEDAIDSKAKIEFRESVLQGLDDFPASSKFALQLCKMEVKSSLFCNTRRYFSLHSTPVATDHRHLDDVIARHAIYTVTFELMRINAPGHVTTNSPRIVNVLERAIKQKGGGDSVELWRLLLRFHPRADAIVSRALAVCPWSKSLALDAVGRLGGGFLAEAVKHLADHGLRVRTPVEEVELLMSLEADDDGEDVVDEDPVVDADGAEQESVTAS